MTDRERILKRKLHQKRSENAELKEKVSYLEEIALAQSRRDNLVYRIRKSIKTGVLNVRTAVFLMDIMEHQISRHRRHDELKKWKADGADLTKKENWYLKNLFYKVADRYYFLCTSIFLEDSMGIPKTTQFRYLKELDKLGLVTSVTKKPTHGNQLRYLHINVEEWDRLLSKQEDNDKKKYRKPLDWY